MTSAKDHALILAILFLLGVIAQGVGGECPKTVTAFKGAAPSLDGFITDAEYAETTSFSGVADWFSDTSQPSQNSSDLSVKAWVKHDGVSLYFAFDVTDDVIYGFDTDRWVSSNNVKANEMNYQNGWPWWGDGIEIMINSTYQWSGTQSCAGDGTSWQFVCSTHKSTLGGLGEGGLMAGEPRNEAAWDHYESWTRNGDMQAAVRLKSGAEGRGYIIEWRINPNPCLQINSSTFVDLAQETKVGINFEIQDLDEKESGDGNWSNFHHIDYWAKVGSYSKTALRSFGTLILSPEKMETNVDNSHIPPSHFSLLNNFPNPFNPSTTIRYNIGEAKFVRLDVCDCRGRLIRNLFLGQQPPGTYEIVWNGRDSQNHSVPSGIYFLILTTDESSESKTQKMTLMK